MENITTIFPSWEAYARALREMLNTEFYGETYPEYEKLCDDFKKCDLVIIKALLDAGYDPQEGFEAFVNACLDGSRYIGEMLYHSIADECSLLQACVDEFIKHGARITPEMSDTLFEVPSDMEEDPEYGFSLIWARGIMLGVFRKYGIEMKDTVEAMDWEEIPEDIDIKTQARMYLKYSSQRCDE